MSERKYVLLCEDGGWFPELITDKIARSGCYQWYKAFNSVEGWTGEVRHVKSVSYEEMRKFDIIHMNLHGTSQALIAQVRKTLGPKNPKEPPYLIVNLDYPPENVDKNMRDPSSFIRALFSADFVFAQIPYQQSLLQFLADHMSGSPFKGKTIPLIPHPVETRMKELVVPLDERMDFIVCQYHRYDDQSFIPAWVTWGMKQVRILLGQTKEYAPMRLWDLTGTLYLPGNFLKYLYILAHSIAGFSYYTIHSQDRFVGECACLKVPCITTTNSYWGYLLFPELQFDPSNLEGMRRALDRLVDNDDYWKEISEKGFERVEYLNWENSVNRLLNAMRSWGLEI